MDRDDQWMVDWYHRVLAKAAGHHLMIDFHGAYKPTGERRTWPNLMTQEGVQGQEYSKWSAAIDPVHNVTLPFTRGLAGPMDFTPGVFENATKASFVGRGDDPMAMGTRVHNMALLVAFESPLMCLADKPWGYENQPGFEFVKAVPATWDETRAIHAQPGEYLTVARRRGKEWFLVGITNWTPRDLTIPLEFLGPGNYTAEIYADSPDAGENPAKLAIEKKAVTRAGSLRARMASGGGYAVRLAPAR
jgi:alpha-glucosidase